MHRTRIALPPRVAALLATAAGALLLYALMHAAWGVAFHTAPHVSAANQLAVARNFSATADTDLSQQNPDTNTGTANSIRVEARTGRFIRSLVIFGGVSQIPTGAGTSIGSATLALSATSAAATRTLGAHRVTPAWTETQATWNVRVTGTSWTAAGGDFNATATGTASTGAGGAQTMSFTVTSDVTLFKDGTANNGWLVKDGSEGTAGNNGEAFTSLDAVTGTKPNLAVTFTPDWDSYDSGCASVTDNFTSGTSSVVCAKGTGFETTAGLYNVGWYDGGGTLRTSNNGLTATSGNLQTPNLTLSGNPTWASGTWEVIVFRSTAAPAIKPANTASANDTNNIVGRDQFTVQATALPEFPSLLAAAAAAALSAGGYILLRRRLRRATRTV